MNLVDIRPRDAGDIAREWASHHGCLRLRDPRLANVPELVELLEGSVLGSIAVSLAYMLRDSAGVRALALGQHWNLRAEDPAQEIIFRNNIGWTILLLRPAESLTSVELFQRIRDESRERGAEMNYATVSISDAESAAFLARNGFEPSYAHCVRKELLDDVPQPPPNVTIRRAVPGEGERVLECHLEELRYHAECAPSQATNYPDRRTRQLAGCEEVIVDPNGVSLYAEVDGEVVAVADGRVGHSYIRPTLMLPEAKIGFIRSVGTSAVWRGRGIGRAISLALAAELQSKGATRLELVYCPWNPLSSRFWPGLGWGPVTMGMSMRE